MSGRSVLAVLPDCPTSFTVTRRGSVGFRACASGYTANMLDTPPFPSGVERWAALRTAARWEKKLAQVLLAAGVPVFLPLMTRFTTSHGKRRAARVPVFPGYLFASEPDFLTNKRLTPGTR